MEIKIPEIGESILEALVANWMKEDGEAVSKDEVICELETDKINVELTAEASGVLHIVVPTGQTVPIGTVIATLEEGEVAEASQAEPAAAAEGCSGRAIGRDNSAEHRQKNRQSNRQSNLQSNRWRTRRPGDKPKSVAST